MKQRLEGLISQAVVRARNAGELTAEAPLPVGFLEVPKDRQHGDVAANLAMAMARAERKAPRVVAEAIVRHLEDPEGWIERTEIAGPGFLNLWLSRRFWQRELATALADPRLGVQAVAAGQRVQVEFVSANPTGPLTVGHGRNAVLGDTLASLLAAVGWTVEREYYFNNAGRQMSVLAASVRARYLECLGKPSSFPEDGYQGDYIREIAAALVQARGESLVALAEASTRPPAEPASAAESTATGGTEPVAGPRDDPFLAAAEDAIFTGIRATQDRLGIRFDVYFNEDSLYRSGAIDQVLRDLDARGLTERREGALWLRGEAVGLEKDRVLVKSSGEPAYRLPDVAYHENKLARGFDLIVDVLGADHIAEHREVAAALRALGRPAERIRPVIYQFVTLTRHGEQVKMSTRRAEYVTLDELLDEVGVDAVRFFFLSRKSDSHLEFDLELAKKRSTDNPVYYVQYAHARIANLFEKARGEGISVPAASGAVQMGEGLDLPEEFELVRSIASYGETVAGAAADLEPHRIVFYLQELAAALHRYYNQQRILGDDDRERLHARLVLLEGVRRVIAAGLGLLGVSAPERM